MPVYEKISLLDRFFGSDASREIYRTPKPNVAFYLKTRILKIDKNIIDAIQKPYNKKSVLENDIENINKNYGNESEFIKRPQSVLNTTVMPDKTFKGGHTNLQARITKENQKHDDTYGSVRALDVIRHAAEILLSWTTLRQAYLQRLNVRNARIFNPAVTIKGLIPLLSDNWVAKIASFVEIRRPFGVIPYEDTVAKRSGDKGNFVEGHGNKLSFINDRLQRELKGNVYQSKGLTEGNKVEYKIYDPVKQLGDKINDFFAAKFQKDTIDGSTNIKLKGLDTVMTEQNVYTPSERKVSRIAKRLFTRFSPLIPGGKTITETGFEYNEAYEAGGPGTSEVINGKLAKYKITFDPTLTNVQESPDGIFQPGVDVIDVIKDKGSAQRKKNRDFVGDRIKDIDTFLPRAEKIKDETVFGAEKIKLNKALEANLTVPFYFTDYRIGGSYCFFNAILDGLSETYTPNWSETDYFGRSEGIAIYGNTKRNVSLQFKIVINSPDELTVAYEKINWLTQRVYPEYSNVDNEGNVSKFEAALQNPPLVTLRLGDLITSKKNPARGLGGFISALTYSYPPDAGWEIESNRKVPKGIDISLEYSVLHDTIPGMDTRFYGIGKLQE